jgi:hypothetical protein
MRYVFFGDRKLMPHATCHSRCELALGFCHSRRNVVSEAIYLQVASNLLASRSPHCVRDDNPELVIANSERVKQSACKQHLFLDYFATLVMTKAKIAALRSR